MSGQAGRNSSPPGCPLGPHETSRVQVFSNIHFSSSYLTERNCS